MIRNIIRIFIALAVASIVGCGSEGSSSSSSLWKVEKKTTTAKNNVETEAEYEEEDGWFVSFDGNAAVLQKETAGAMVTIGYGRVDGEKGTIVLSADTFSGIIASLSFSGSDYVNLKSTFAEYAELKNLAAEWNKNPAKSDAGAKADALSKLDTIKGKFSTKDSIVAQCEKSSRDSNADFWTKVKTFLGSEAADEMDLEDAAELFDYYDPAARNVNSADSSNAWILSTNARLDAVQYGVYKDMYDKISAGQSIDISEKSNLGKIIAFVLEEENEIDELDEIGMASKSGDLGVVCPWVNGTYTDNGNGEIKNEYYRFVKIAEDIDQAI